MSSQRRAWRAEGAQLRRTCRRCEAVCNVLCCRRGVRASHGDRVIGSISSAVHRRCRFLRSQWSLQLCCRSWKTVLCDLILGRIEETVVTAVHCNLLLAACAASIWPLVYITVGRHAAQVQAGNKLVVHVERCEGVCDVAEQQRTARIYSRIACDIMAARQLRD